MPPGAGTVLAALLLRAPRGIASTHRPAPRTPPRGLAAAADLQLSLPGEKDSSSMITQTLAAAARRKASGNSRLKFILIPLRTIYRWTRAMRWRLIRPPLETLPNAPDLFAIYRHLHEHPDLERAPGGWNYRGEFYPDYLTVGGAGRYAARRGPPQRRRGFRRRIDGFRLQLSLP